MNAFNFFLGACLMGTWVFVPAFIVALIMLKAPGRAFFASAAFTVGAAITFAAAIAFYVAGRKGDVDFNLPDTLLGNAMTLLYFSAAGVGGGVFALFLYNKFSKTLPGRRS